MFNLIPTSLFIMALGGIVYIISNHLSEFSDEEEKHDPIFSLRTYFANYINQLPLDNIKTQSLSLTQKILHRFRLALLKTDNRLMKLIGKISERDKRINGNGYNGKNSGEADFWENLLKSKQDSQIVEPIIQEDAKIEFVVDKNKKIEKFFDIKPAKIFSKIPAYAKALAGKSEGKPDKKTLKTKKYLK